MHSQRKSRGNPSTERRTDSETATVRTSYGRWFVGLTVMDEVNSQLHSLGQPHQLPPLAYVRLVLSRIPAHFNFLTQLTWVVCMILTLGFATPFHFFSIIWLPNRPVAQLLLEVYLHKCVLGLLASLSLFPRSLWIHIGSNSPSSRTWILFGSLNFSKFHYFSKKRREDKGSASGVWSSRYRSKLRFILSLGPNLYFYFLDWTCKCIAR
jgi:hypothetical protein